MFFKKIFALVIFTGTFALAEQQRGEALINSAAERLQETDGNGENVRSVVLDSLSHEQRQSHDRCEYCRGVAHSFGRIKFEFLMVQNPDAPFGKMQRLYRMAQMQPCSCGCRPDLINNIIVTLAAKWHQVSPDKIQRLRSNNELYYDLTTQP